MIAYISPLVPKRTGIALYSHHLIQALQVGLAKSGDSLAVFDDDVSETNTYQSDYKAKEILPLIFEKKKREQYSQFIYHIGNNSLYHLPILDLLQRQKGIVVLHDTVLYYLISGQGSGGLWKALTRQSPNLNNLEQVRTIINDSPNNNILHYPSPSNYTFLKEVLLHATAIVVHSQIAREHVVNANFQGPIHQVPLLDYNQSQISSTSTIENNLLLDLVKKKDDSNLFVIGLFGHGGSTKCSHDIFQALSELNADTRAQLKLIIIGNDQYQAEIDSMDLSEAIINIGYGNESDYDSGMAICDLIINLRYPSMGETSAVQIQAMSAEKATIVTDNGWFSELDDDSVHKIPPSDQLVAELKQAIIKMMSDESYRITIAHKARQYVTKYHCPKKVSQLWLELIQKSY